MDPERHASHDAYEQIMWSRFGGRCAIVFSSLVGCTRRAITAAWVGLLMVFALVGGCGNTSHQAAPAADVDRASTVTPPAGLRDGQAVSVLALTGLSRTNRTARLRVDECPSVTPAHGDCTELGTVSRNSVETEKRGELVFTGTVIVRKTVGWLHRYKCTNQCVLIVDDFFRRYGHEMTLTFR